MHQCSDCGQSYDTSTGLQIHQSRHCNGKSYKDKETLYELYHTKRQSLQEIADDHNVTKQSVHQWMKRHGIERRDQKKAQSEKIRVERAQYTTTEAGYPYWKSANPDTGNVDQVAVSRLLYVAHFGTEMLGDRHVHHINGCSWDNRPSNLAAMTASDHAKVGNLKRQGKIG